MNVEHVAASHIKGQVRLAGASAGDGGSSDSCCRGNRSGAATGNSRSGSSNKQ